jgi:hypothetical protein
VSRQQNRANPGVPDIEGHYRITYFITFLDHVIHHLSTRFPDKLDDALIATYLLPSYISGLSAEIIEKIKTEFEDILPLASAFVNEVATWKVHLSEVTIDTENMADLLYICKYAFKNKLYFPNIHVILSLLLKIPDGSCSCERSFSSLRGFKTWCRSTTSNQRLDSLTVGYINKEYLQSISPEDVLKAWDRSGHRRISLAFSSL